MACSGTLWAARSMWRLWRGQTSSSTWQVHAHTQPPLSLPPQHNNTTASSLNAQTPPRPDTPPCPFPSSVCVGSRGERGQWLDRLAACTARGLERQEEGTEHKRRPQHTTLDLVKRPGKEARRLFSHCVDGVDVDVVCDPGVSPCGHVDPRQGHQLHEDTTQGTPPKPSHIRERPEGLQW